MKKHLLLLILILFMHPVIAQNRYTVIIDEIMADPSPAVGLPEYEWIELKNTSTVPVNLRNWRIGDANGQSGPLPAFTLQPDSFLIICTATALPTLSSYGHALSVTSFPSLDNDGDLLFLKGADGSIIHAVHYSLSWYGNELKKQGGWSLEMIDTKSPCTGHTNWTASAATRGGTPGMINAVDAINTDAIAPRLINAYTISNRDIVIAYDEPVDSLSGATIGHYAIDGLTIVAAITLPPLFDHVQLTASTDLVTGNLYTVTVKGVIDCNNNSIDNDSIPTGLPATARSGELVINEILFNPRPNAFDYIELYNNSNKIFDAGVLSIANRNSSGVISSIKTLSAIPHYIFPGDYIVITENTDNLSLNYLVRYPAHVLTPGTLPSFPDTEGEVIVLDAQGMVLDEVKYTEDWHFKLLNNREGIALERIDASSDSNDPLNWHSAASTAGYGTPTYKNSQFKNRDAVNGRIVITPAVFSPDNDGRDDIATIGYKVEEPGYVANMIIFDAAGRIVRTLVHNAILGISGYWNWDGLDDRNRPLPVGPYVVFTEIFNLRGKKSHFKNTIVLGRKLR